MAVNPNETAYQPKPTAVNPNMQTYQPKPTTTPAQQINSAMQTASAQPQQATKSPALANPTGLGGPTAQKYQGMTTQQMVNDLQQKAAQMKAAQAAVQQPSAQTQMAAQTTQEATGNIYRVGDNGQAPKGLKVGDQVVTGGGTFTITGVNPDGTYTSKKTNPNQTTLNYTGTYATAPGAAPAQATQPKQPTYASAYDPDVNYDSEIAKAVAAGNLQAAAVLESLRNQKIDALGLANKYAKTNTYAQYLDGVDPSYAAQLRGGYVETNRIQTPNPYPGMEDMTKQLYDAMGQQIQADIDYNVEQGVNELNRALEDAQPEFQKQRNQNDIDAARAMSNSALYAEARGDRGGIGQSQYNEIQAAAMQNRQAINTAQTKLATDTARQIADLRAQGRHDAATALLQNTQKYLSQLMSLKQAGAEWALNVEQMQNTIDQQLRNHALQVANITGVYEGKPTYAAQKNEQAAAQELLMNYLKYGGMPSDALLNAAGYSAFAGDVSGLANLIAAANFSSGGSGGGGSGGRSGSGSGSGSGTPTYTGQEPTDPDDNVIEYGTGDVKGRTSVAAPKQYGGTSSAGNLTSLSYSPDEGIFTWNGKSYNHVNALIKDINAAGLTADQEAVFLKKLESWGFKKKGGRVWQLATSPKVN